MKLTKEGEKLYTALMSTYTNLIKKTLVEGEAKVYFPKDEFIEMAQRRNIPLCYKHFNGCLLFLMERIKYE